MDYGKLSSTLSRLLEGLQKRDIASLRKLGSSLGEVALVENEHAYIEIALAAYSCSKLLEKPHFANAISWKKSLPKIVGLAGEALAAAGKEKAGIASRKISSLNKQVEKASSATGRFHMSVLQKARIKVGADIYAHGASLGRACELTGAPKEKLQPYIGGTRLADKYQTMPVAERMQRTMALFAPAH